VLLRPNHLLFTWIMFSNTGLLQGEQVADQAVLTCEKVSLARPGRGVAYKGTVRNSDYRFSATIPDGLEGWGAGQNAPFHGFTFYPNHASELTICVAFSIQIHVDLEEDHAVPAQRIAATRPVRVGNRTGLKTSTAGRAKGTSYENETVFLELPRRGYRNDVVITMVTPTSERERAEDVFARFLSSFHFR
jgi:hypothetical protein